VTARIPKAVLAHFEGIPLFSGVSHKGLRAIVSAADEIDEPAGTTLVKEGDLRRELFVITAGTASVTRKGKPLASLGTGDFFGEIALLSGGPRTATVTASSDVSLMILAPSRFLAVLDAEPNVMEAIVRALGERLRRTEKSPVD
jgi:CRP/FNR family transcriptional regulator, cyclic AMP receptor protein